MELTFEKRLYKHFLVLAAVQSHGAALIHADPALRADKEVFHR